MVFSPVFSAAVGPWAAAVWLLCCVPTTAAVSYDMRLRTLVLADTVHDLALPRIFLNGVGAEYVTEFDTLPTLETASGPQFSSIVITSDLSNWGPGEALDTVRQYAAKYNVRIAFLNTKSSETVSGVGATVSSSATKGTHISFDSATMAANPSLADVVNEKGLWQITLPYNLAPNYFLLTANAGNPPVAFMRYGTPTDTQGDVAAIVGKTQYGTEEMYFGFDTSFSETCSDFEQCQDGLDYVQYGQETLLTLSLANVWFTWVTRGVFTGQRRVSFQLHVDDWYCATQLYDEYDADGSFRLNSDDVDFIVDWQKNVLSNHNLPAGSNFVFEPAFNGANFMANRQADAAAMAAGKSLSASTMKHLNDFNWISHTWTHQNLDWATPDFCNGQWYTCKLASDRMNIEIEYNQLLASGKGIVINRTILPDDVFYEDDTPAANVTAIPTARLSSKSLVTPEISGLYPRDYWWDPSTWPSWKPLPRPDNADVMTVLRNRGIDCVTGDNSRRELLSNVSIHHPVTTTSDRYTVTGLTIIPRHTLPIAYNTHDEEKYLDYYNAPGSSQCWGTPGPDCTLKEVYTLQDVMDRLSYNALYMLLQYRQDPYMFHQANLHAFTLSSTGKKAALLTYFADNTFEGYLKYLNKMPLTSPQMDDICNVFRNREKRDQCAASAYVTVTDGKWASVRVQSDKTCTAPALLTVRRCNHQAPAGLSPDYYGMDATFEMPVGSQNGPSYSWKLSDDNFGCITDDAPPLVDTDMPSSTTNPPAPTTTAESSTNEPSSTAQPSGEASATVTVTTCTSQCAAPTTKTTTATETIVVTTSLIPGISTTTATTTAITTTTVADGQTVVSTVIVPELVTDTVTMVESVVSLSTVTLVTTTSVAGNSGTVTLTTTEPTTETSTILQTTVSPTTTTSTATSVTTTSVATTATVTWTTSSIVSSTVTATVTTTVPTTSTTTTTTTSSSILTTTRPTTTTRSTTTTTTTTRPTTTTRSTTTTTTTTRPTTTTRSTTTTTTTTRPTTTTRSSTTTTTRTNTSTKTTTVPTTTTKMSTVTKTVTK